MPEAVTKATLEQYRHSEAVTEIKEFADRAHSLTVAEDHGAATPAGSDQTTHIGHNGDPAVG